MIDSHCHLDHEPLYKNLSTIINRSKENGITKLLTICTTLDSFENIKAIVKKDQMIYGTYGIHPHETESNHVDKQTIIRSVNENVKIIGIGETGLDFFYNYSDRERQISSFIEHIEASIELNKPIIIHSRDAEKETFEILNSYKGKNLKILMHCFTGSLEFSKKLEKLLIETDSPFLAPIPMRGKKNEPSFIKYTLEKLSTLKETTIDKMSIITTDNFNKLFNL